MSHQSGSTSGRVAERIHAIGLDGEPDDVFPLFGPIREADWAAGWDPEVVAGDALQPELGCVFRTTGAERGETIWLIAELDASKRRIGYVRTTPTSDLTQIVIDVRPDSPGQSQAQITYRVTGLSDAGNRYVEQFTHERYVEWLKEWAVAINHYLATGEQHPTHL